MPNYVRLISIAVVAVVLVAATIYFAIKIEFLSIVIVIILFTEVIRLTIKVDRVETDRADDKAEIVKLMRKASIAETTSTKNTERFLSQKDDVKCLQDQMEQVHHWLGVLNVSDLIRTETGVETLDVVEVLRQKIEWQKELDRQQSQDDSNYYKGE
jgi:hypothetical protein